MIIQLLLSLCCAVNADLLTQRDTVSGYYVERYPSSEVKLDYENTRRNLKDGGIRGLYDRTVLSCFIPLQESLSQDSISYEWLNEQFSASSDSVFLFGHPILGGDAWIVSQSLFDNGKKQNEYYQRITVVSKYLKRALSLSPYFSDEEGQYVYRIVYLNAQIDKLEYDSLPKKVQRGMRLLSYNVKYYFILWDLIDYNPYLSFPKLSVWLPNYKYDD